MSSSFQEAVDAVTVMVPRSANNCMCRAVSFGSCVAFSATGKVNQMDSCEYMILSELTVTASPWHEQSVRCLMKAQEDDLPSLCHPLSREPPTLTRTISLAVAVDICDSYQESIGLSIIEVARDFDVYSKLCARIR